MNYLGTELAQFSDQIRYALNHYTSHGIAKDEIDHVVLCGLGGSGIAGRIAKNYFSDKLDLPIELVADYQLPRFVNERSLVVLCSYSGNTEETIAMYESAKAKASKRIVITVGGSLGELARRDGVRLYEAPGGYQPRVAFGYPFTYLILIISELMGLSEQADLITVAERVKNVDDYKQQTALLREKLKATIKQKYVIVCDPVNEGIAIRFAQQVQENAKLEAFVSVIPEANHNMIESYYEKHDTNFIFLNSGSNQRINMRMFFIQELLAKYDSTVLEIIPREATLDTVFHTVYLFDWLSLQIADEVQAVSNSIVNINNLKTFLTKHS